MDIEAGASPRETATGALTRSSRRFSELRRAHADLLDADDELADGLDAGTRCAARGNVTARVLETGPGACALDSWLERLAGGPGLLILDGLIAADTCLAGRTASELMGGGDLLGPAYTRSDELVAPVSSWHALLPTRLAVLDAGFLERARPWPQIVRALLRRAERRCEELAYMRAVCSQPKLELRLVLLLWHLGARWGRVEPGGIRLSLPLTHRLLGQLAAAERPSISHALGRLARADVVTGPTNDLHLRGTLAEQLRVLERTPAHG